MILYNNKTLIHETLHLWWGDNSVHFENRVITEGIVEFLSLLFKRIKKTRLFKPSFIS
jgi:hypothetical protein